VELSIVERTVRCVMVGHGQARLEPRPKLLKTIGRANQASAGVYADVIAPGTVNQADLAHIS